MRRLVWTGFWIVALLGFATCGIILLWPPLQGPFSPSDCERVQMGMTLTEVESIFGPAVPDAESALMPRSDDYPTFWKAWRGDVNDLHVQFDRNERVQAWVLQPRHPLLSHWLLNRLAP